MALEIELLNPVPKNYWQEHVDKQDHLVGAIHKGVILLGDISGYTGLVTRTELEHSQSILQFLFDRVYDATGEQFIVNEIEGDAIFAYAVEPRDPGALVSATLDQLKEYGHAFYHARQEMLEKPADENSCQCGACTNIHVLSFKFIVHLSEFGVNKVGPFVKLVGADVVLAHRLLKNDVPGNEYILLTKKTLALLPQSEQDKFTFATETIDKFGDVEVGYRIFNWDDEDKKHHSEG